MTERETRLQAFVDWCAAHIRGDEKDEAAIFLDHLFRALGHAGLKEAGRPRRNEETRRRPDRHPLQPPRRVQRRASPPGAGNAAVGRLPGHKEVGAMQAVNTPSDNLAVASEAGKQGPSGNTPEPTAERWREENRAALESSNSCVNKQALHLTRYRQF